MDRSKSTVRFIVFLSIVLCTLISLTIVRSGPVAAKELRFATTAAGTDCGSVGYEWWLSEIERRTKGALKFERFWAGSLMPGPKIIDGIDSGVADVGQLIMAYYAGKLPLHTVANTPGTGGYSTWARAQAFMDLYDRVPALRAELEEYDAVPIAIRGSTGLNLITKEPVRKLADMKGMKIRCTGYAQKTIAELGAVPVYLSWGEIYTALDRGTVEGTFMDLTAIASLKLYESAKNITMLRQADTMIVLVIKKEVLKDLPESASKVILDLAEEEAITGIMRAYYNCPKAAATFDLKNGLFPKEGVEIINLPSEDRPVLKTVEEKVRNMWIAEMSKKGFEAEKIYNTFAELCAQWDKKTPNEFKGK